MRVIYEPTGAAKEYADLAFNSYIGCENACTYCFAPGVMHKKPEQYHASVMPRSDKVLSDFEKDCADMQKRGDKRRVHLNFISDPYPECECELHVTRRCIETAMRYGVGVNILTKGKLDVLRPDLELFKDAGVHFGVTCCFTVDASRTEWEPNAASVGDRMRILTEAHNAGIFTWVSLEPVIYPDQAIAFFGVMYPWVDLWKVGKLNYNPHAKTVDWSKFREDFVRNANAVGAKYIIKKSLMEAKN